MRAPRGPPRPAGPAPGHQLTQSGPPRGGKGNERSERPVGAHPVVVSEVTKAVWGGQAGGGGVGLHLARSKLAGGFRRAALQAEDRPQLLLTPELL